MQALGRTSHVTLIEGLARMLARISRILHAGDGPLIEFVIAEWPATLPCFRGSVRKWLLQAGRPSISCVLRLVSSRSIYPCGPGFLWLDSRINIHAAFGAWLRLATPQPLLAAPDFTASLARRSALGFKQRVANSGHSADAGNSTHA